MLCTPCLSEGSVDLGVVRKAQYAAKEIGGAFFGYPKSEEAHCNGAAHDQCQRRVPSAKQVEKANDFARIGHAREHQTQAKQQTDDEFNDVVEMVFLNHDFFP